MSLHQIAPCERQDGRPPPTPELTRTQQNHSPTPSHSTGDILVSTCCSEDQVNNVTAPSHLHLPTHRAHEGNESQDLHVAPRLPAAELEKEGGQPVFQHNTHAAFSLNAANVKHTG